MHGLFGAIQPPQRRGDDTAGLGGFDPNAPGEPHDYPLPPSTGPAFRNSTVTRTTSGTDLAPATETSLLLIPTLPIGSQPAAGWPESGLTGSGSGSDVSPGDLLLVSSPNAGASVALLKALESASPPQTSPPTSVDGTKTLVERQVPAHSVQPRVAEQGLDSDETLDESKEAPAAEGGISVTNLLVLVSLPVVFASWLRYRLKPKEQLGS
jgi:hypothetical protein